MQNQGLPRLQSKVNVSLGNLPRLYLKIIVGPGEIVQQLRVLAALAEAGPGFSSQHFRGSSQPSIILISGI